MGLPSGHFYVNGREIASLDKKVIQPTSLKQPFQLPHWAWIFMVLCILIPILTLGGAIPALLGFGGASGCAMIAKKRTLSFKSKLTLCLSITVISWVLTILLIVFVHHLSGQHR
jgi:hypothetical protein